MNLAVDVPWPQAFLGFIDFSKIINIDFMSIASPFSPCSFKVSYLSVFYTHMLIIPILVALTGMVLLVLRRRRPASVHVSMTEMVVRVLNVIVFVLYPGIGTRIFRLFKCRTVGAEAYLEADFSVVCWKEQHTIAVAVASLCILVYVVGIPAMSVYLLYKRKDRLNDPKTVNLFGSLYLAYERPYWYWEAVEMLKKMVLAGGLVIVAAGSSAQVLIGVLISLFYLIVVVRLEPFDDVVDDRLQMATSLQILLNLQMGLVLKLDAKKDYDSQVLGVILVLMNVGVMLLGVFVACMAFPSCSRKGLREGWKACRKRCTVEQVKGTVSGVQKRVLLGRLSKALKGSVNDAMYKQGMAVGVKMGDSGLTLAQAEELWKPIIRAIHLRKKKRDVLNLYKKLYVSVERRAPKTLELDSFQWNTNAMHSHRKSVSI